MKRNILVIDNSPTLVKFMTYGLKACGYEVIAAADGMQALETVSNLDHDIDLVITSLNMPQIDGYELIRILRDNERFTDTPIIILSSQEEAADRQRGREAGSSSFLAKPLQSSALLSEVSRLLR